MEDREIQSNLQPITGTDMLSLLTILMVAVYLYMIGWHKNWGYMLSAPFIVSLLAGRAWVWEGQPPINEVGYLVNLLEIGIIGYGALVGVIIGTKRACRDLDAYMTRRVNRG